VVWCKRRGYNPGDIHHEYDFPEEIGAFPSEIMQTAPMPWGGIVFIMNTTPDEIGSSGLLPLSGLVRVEGLYFRFRVLGF
jgi:hypothetical protein